MSNNLETYYQDHWAEVEPERMERYEMMFQWREGQEVLIKPAGVGAGQTVVDYGCGPGALSIELARRVGSSGKVIALDINEQFLQKTRDYAEREGFKDRVDTRHMVDDKIPVDDQSVARVLCKNVLEYVPDPEVTVAEFRRILKPGGIAHVSDSDWGTVLLEPLAERFERIMSAAGIAFRTPLIGRKLYGIFQRAGFTDIKVQVLATADTVGGLRPVIQNMTSYARLSGEIEESELVEFLQDVDQAIEQQTFFAVLPQFLVTGRA